MDFGRGNELGSVGTDLSHGKIGRSTYTISRAPLQPTPWSSGGAAKETGPGRARLPRLHRKHRFCHACATNTMFSAWAKKRFSALPFGTSLRCTSQWPEVRPPELALIRTIRRRSWHSLLSTMQAKPDGRWLVWIYLRAPIRGRCLRSSFVRPD